MQDQRHRYVFADPTMHVDYITITTHNNATTLGSSISEVDQKHRKTDFGCSTSQSLGILTHNLGNLMNSEMSNVEFL